MEVGNPDIWSARRRSVRVPVHSARIGGSCPHPNGRAAAALPAFRQSLLSCRPSFYTTSTPTTLILQLSQLDILNLEGRKRLSPGTKPSADPFLQLATGNWRLTNGP